MVTLKTKYFGDFNSQYSNKIWFEMTNVFKLILNVQR